MYECELYGLHVPVPFVLDIFLPYAVQPGTSNHMTKQQTVPGPMEDGPGDKRDVTDGE